MIELAAVEKRFGTRHVLSAVDLRITAPAVVGMIGDNGAGKTTLLRLIAGILRADAGTLRVLGADPTTDHSFRQELGALLERPGHYDELSVRANLTYFYSFYSDDAAAVASAVEESMRRFGLSARADETAGRLSSGYRQRLAIARAAHPWARLLLLDEPFDGLDPRARNEVKSELRDLQDGRRVILFSSHNLLDVDQLCDSILLIARGTATPFESFHQIRSMLGAVGTDDLDAVYARLTEGVGTCT